MTSEYNNPSQDYLRTLFDRASCLLLDFDGPMCRLFANGHAPDIAREMHGLVGAELTSELKDSSDPHAIVRASPSLDLTLQLELELRLTAGEMVAARSAVRTVGARAFVRAARRRGRVLAITTNNAPEAVESYLKRQWLRRAFAGRIFGRIPGEPNRMKPDPDCLERAIKALGADREDCLMIGDSKPDADAAAAAEVPFLGYASSEERVARFAGYADDVTVVVGMRPLAEAMRKARRM